MRFDIYVHFDFVGPDMSGVNARLDSIVSLINGLKTGVATMSAELDTLTTEVSEMNTVVDSAVALINGLSAQIIALKDDPVKLAALAASLDAKAAELAGAVAANTPTP